MLFHTRFNYYFFLRHLVKPTTPSKQQIDGAEAAQRAKGLNPKMNCRATGEAAGKSAFRHDAVQKVHGVNVNKFSLVLQKNLLNIRSLRLFLP